MGLVLNLCIKYLPTCPQDEEHWPDLFVTSVLVLFDVQSKCKCVLESKFAERFIDDYIFTGFGGIIVGGLISNQYCWFSFSGVHLYLLTVCSRAKFAVRVFNAVTDKYLPTRINSSEK